MWQDGRNKQSSGGKEQGWAVGSLGARGLGKNSAEQARSPLGENTPKAENQEPQGLARPKKLRRPAWVSAGAQKHHLLPAQRAGGFPSSAPALRWGKGMRREETEPSGSRILVTAKQVFLPGPPPSASSHLRPLRKGGLSLGRSTSNSLIPI